MSKHTGEREKICSGQREEGILWTMTFIKGDALFMYTDKGRSATEDWEGNTATGMNDKHYNKSWAS